MSELRTLAQEGLSLAVRLPILVAAATARAAGGGVGILAGAVVALTLMFVVALFLALVPFLALAVLGGVLSRKSPRPAARYLDWKPEDR
ncbi:MAG: hypothetical protein XD60_1751 [Acetothermia bacterium 64_32]|nr:MAG: hypothetical protein XD60_1751 [Acetothermia bacterium 64_32]HAF71322.1 hypothetical protein [Candidatus Acetothermia bacterium]